MASDHRQERIAANEASFRDINERLEQGLLQARGGPELQQFLCECGDRGCEQVISLSFEEYEAVRRDSRRFAVAPGHVIADVERVVASNDRYEVLEKLGAAIKVTDATDTRSPGPGGRRGGDPLP